MIEFRPITLADKAEIESYTLQSEIRNCDLSFANMYCWQRSYDSAWAVVDGYLVIRFRIEGGEKLGYMQPIGHDGSLDFSRIIPSLAQDAHTHGDRLRIIGVTEEGRRTLQSQYSSAFALYSDPNFEDYIYLRESLRTISGKKLQPKRNHINQFERAYPNYEYRPLTSEYFEEALTLDCRWRATHGEPCSESTPERNAMLRAFEHFEELELRGGALFVDGRMIAFTYGSRINHDTFCTHVEKGEAEYTGCYTVINKLFAESLAEEFTYINREEDLGIEGLRRSKSSYYPTIKQEKYTAIYLHHDEAECKRLWIEVFGDEESFVDEFIINHYSQRRMLRVVDPMNRTLSMLHIIPFECEIGRIAYIYGVATDASVRKQGYASKLITSALEMIRKEGYTATILIPSEESTRIFYSKFGFTDGRPLLFNSYNRFDFGSGESAKDLSMIAFMSDSISLPDVLNLKS